MQGQGRPVDDRQGLHGHAVAAVEDKRAGAHVVAVEAQAVRDAGRTDLFGGQAVVDGILAQEFEQAVVRVVVADCEDIQDIALKGVFEGIPFHIIAGVPVEAVEAVEFFQRQHDDRELDHAGGIEIPVRGYPVVVIGKAYRIAFPEYAGIPYLHLVGIRGCHDPGDGRLIGGKHHLKGVFSRRFRPAGGQHQEEKASKPADP